MASRYGLMERLAEMAAAGKPFVLVTLVEAVGSTPQDPGTKMLVDAAGLRFGTVGGGRLEERAIAAARDMLADPAAKPCRLVEWNLKRDVGMTCGGTVKILFETHNLDCWRVVVFGAGHVAQALVRCLMLLDCQVACVDSRAHWLDRLPDSSQLEKVRLDEPRDFVRRLANDDFVVCMTMGHASDRPILEAICRSGLELAYLGVIGSRAKREVLCRELEAAGIPPVSFEPLRCPVGLPVGGNRPGEIAVSVAAEILQVRDAARKA